MTDNKWFDGSVDFISVQNFFSFCYINTLIIALKYAIVYLQYNMFLFFAEQLSNLHDFV